MLSLLMVAYVGATLVADVSTRADNLSKYDAIRISFKDNDTNIPLPPQRVQRAGILVFRDDFSSSIINRNNWNYEVSMYGGYNGEFQVYTTDASNVFTRNGYLYIKPTLTVNDARFDEQSLLYGTMDVTKLWGTCTNNDHGGCVRHGQDGLLPPVMSGKLTSKHTLTFGRIEVRAKIPKGDWIWPAIWMLPKTSVYGGWPRSGDIDIVESRGNTVARSPDGVNQGNNQILAKMNWGSDSNHDGFKMTYATKQSPVLWSADFHIYSLDWTVDQITIKVDDAVVLHVPTPADGFWSYGHFPGHNIWTNGGKNAPFDTPFYLIMSVAVGGTNGFFADNWTYNSGKPWQNTSPTASADFWRKRSNWEPTWSRDDVAMIVDYVQMMQY